ncbi:putative membrane protein At1g16860 [Apium graveolens]|uniref:putative membrane protein At1g16860 n=1 Tax=Apium graveolens TaxID=4045 RepID=UPI003D7A9593
MTTRSHSHQLSSGLYVSGRPEPPLKDRQPTLISRAVPYTGGDVKNSGELGKMFDIESCEPPVLKPSRLSSFSRQKSGSDLIGSGRDPGPRLSGQMVPVLPTGLLTSGPLGSNPGRRSGKLDPGPMGGSGKKVVYGSAVTSLSGEERMGFKVSKAAMWVFLVVVVMGLVVGVFLMVAVKKALILVVVAAVLVVLVVVVLWNLAMKRRGLVGFLKRYGVSELRGASDGQFVKVTGIVTCGSIPLETSFQKISRCVYVSTELLEYRGLGGKPANPKHRFFSWGCRNSERYVADFYISDFQTGLRVIVKAGYGAKVAPFVRPTTVMNVSETNKELSPSFLSWLADRNLSSDDRVMRLKESYIKEGSTVSVMGVVRRHDNVLMIVPPAEPTSTGWQWTRCLLPTCTEGLVLMCDENQNADVIPV